LIPIERMMENVRAIAKNPMIAASDEVNEGIFAIEKNKTGKN